MVFDTGAKSSWVHSTANWGSPSTANRDRHIYRPYAPRLVYQNDDPSSPEEQFETEYVSGPTVAGFVVQDTIKAGSLRLVDVYFGALTEANGVGSEMDGLLGFGHRNPNAPLFYNDLNNKPSFWDTLLAADVLEEPCFSFDASDPREAIVELGRTDPSEFVQGFKAPVVPDSPYWRFSKIAFWSDDDDFLGEVTDVDMDTAGLNYLPASVVTGYYSSISDSGAYRRVGSEWQVRCDADLPALIMQLGGQPLLFGTAPPRPNTFSQLVVSTGGVYMKVKMGNSDAIGGWCLGSMQASKGDGVAILGASFFRGLRTEWCSDSSSGTLDRYIRVGLYANPDNTQIVERPDLKLKDPYALGGSDDEDSADDEIWPSVLLESQKDVQYDSGVTDPFGLKARPSGLNGSASSSTGSTRSTSSLSTASSATSWSVSSGTTAFSSTLTSSSSISSSSSSTSTTVPIAPPPIDGITAGELGLSATSNSGLLASIASGITAAAAALGLGIGLGKSHTNYNVTNPNFANAGPYVNITGASTALDASMVVHVQVDNATFSQLLNNVQSDFDRGKGPDLTTNYSTTYQDIGFDYRMKRGQEKDGRIAFNQTLGFVQWARIDGLRNLFSIGVYQWQTVCAVAYMTVYNTSGPSSEIPTTFGC